MLMLGAARWYRLAAESGNVQLFACGIHQKTFPSG
jgi:hypothetical protein